MSLPYPRTLASARRLAVLVAIACALPGRTASAGPTPSIFRDGFEPIAIVTVEEVQLGMAEGTFLLADRTVVARSADAKHLWIADALGAAPYQGVYVYRGSAAQPLPADVASGARVDVVGSAVEFDVSPPGDTLTQVSANSLVVVSAPAGSPVPLSVSTVDALASIVEGEPYEGVLVRVNNLLVTSTGSGGRVNVRDNGGNMLVLTNGAGGLSPSPVVGTCYGSVTGVMHLNTFDDERILMPRSAQDLVAGNGCN